MLKRGAQVKEDESQECLEPLELETQQQGLKYNLTFIPSQLLLLSSCSLYIDASSFIATGLNRATN